MRRGRNRMTFPAVLGWKGLHPTSGADWLQRVRSYTGLRQFCFDRQWWSPCHRPRGSLLWHVKPLPSHLKRANACI